MNKNLNSFINLGTVLIIFFLFQRIIKALTLQGEQEADNTTENENNDFDNEVEQNHQRPTYPNSQYYDFAKKIQIALDGLGSDEPAVYDVFKRLKNDKDFLLLKKAFGTRLVDDPFFTTQYHTLISALTDDLDSEEIAHINVILANRNITHRI